MSKIRPQEQIYKIVDTETGFNIYTGRSKNPIKRGKRHAAGSWWKPTYLLNPYRTIVRDDLTDKEYGVYCAVIEHMEICRNRTWIDQGGRNKMSPIRQVLWGPEERTEVGRLGGLVSTGGFATNETTEGRKGNGGRVTGPINVLRANDFIRSLTKEQRKSITSKAGTASFNKKAGVHGRTKEQMTKDGQKAAIVNMRNKTSIFSPDYDRRKGGSVSGPRNAESGHMARIQKEYNHSRWHVQTYAGPIEDCFLCNMSRSDKKKASREREYAKRRTKRASSKKS